MKKTRRVFCFEWTKNEHEAENRVTAVCCVYVSIYFGYWSVDIVLVS